MILYIILLLNCGLYIIPDMNDYQSEPENLDNIIQGIEE